MKLPNESSSVSCFTADALKIAEGIPSQSSISLPHSTPTNPIDLFMFPYEA